jgi:hypothetical protein
MLPATGSPAMGVVPLYRSESDDAPSSLNPIEEKAVSFEEKYFNENFYATRSSRKKLRSATQDRSPVEEKRIAFQIAEKAVGQKAAHVRNGWKKGDLDGLDRLVQVVFIALGREFKEHQIAKLNGVFMRMIESHRPRQLDLTTKHTSSSLKYTFTRTSPEPKG